MNRPRAVPSSTTQYRSPQSSAFSSVSVLLVLAVTIGTRGNGDAAKVIESVAPNGLERIWRCVHGQRVKQSLHLHHRFRECLDSALEPSLNGFFGQPEEWRGNTSRR